jgi:hypothetical protein
LMDTWARPLLIGQRAPRKSRCTENRAGGEPRPLGILPNLQKSIGYESCTPACALCTVDSAEALFRDHGSLRDRHRRWQVAVGHDELRLRIDRQLSLPLSSIEVLGEPAGAVRLVHWALVRRTPGVANLLGTDSRPEGRKTENRTHWPTSAWPRHSGKILRSQPGVPMMQASDHGHLDDSALVEALNRSRLW